MPKIGSKYRTPPNHLRQLRKLKKDYMIERVIGEGKFGFVCNATMGTGDQKVEIAVKIINLRKHGKDIRTKFLPNELHHLNILSHKYIVEMYDIKLIEMTCYIFMEMAFGGDLIEMLEEKQFKRGIPETRTKSLYRMIVKAVKYIHDKGSAHRDIKCENILLMDEERTIAKLTDFGFSTTCFIPNTRKKLLRETLVGAPIYSAPEILIRQPYDAMKADVWSLGVVLYTSLQNELPFSDNEWSKLAFQSKPIELEFSEKHLSNEVKDLITKQIVLDPNERLTMADVLKHQWLR